jgi:hypothetical protein
MKKSDLKTGMIVIFISNQIDKYIVLKDSRAGDIFLGINGGRIPFDSISNDLLCLHNHNFDIVRVYDIHNEYKAKDLTKGGDLLWERKEEKPILELDGIEYSERTLRSLIKKALEN